MLIAIERRPLCGPNSTEATVYEARQLREVAVCGLLIGALRLSIALVRASTVR